MVVLDELLFRLQAEGEAVLAYFKTLPPDCWDRIVYPAEEWRVRDVLAHFVAAEQGFHLLIQNVAEGGPGAEVDFNIDEYNHVTVHELRSSEVEVLLGQYAMARERTLALLRELTPDQLTITGRHPMVGVLPLGDMLRVIYNHNNLHLRDVRKVVKNAEGASAANLPTGEER